MAADKIWTSFFDGLTGAGIFGDLQLPGAPTRMFKPEYQDTLLEVTVKADEVYLVDIVDIRKKSGAQVNAAEAAEVLAELSRLLNQEGATDRAETRLRESWKNA